MKSTNNIPSHHSSRGCLIFAFKQKVKDRTLCNDSMPLGKKELWRKTEEVNGNQISWTISSESFYPNLHFLINKRQFNAFSLISPTTVIESNGGKVASSRCNKWLERLWVPSLGSFIKLTHSNKSKSLNPKRPGVFQHFAWYFAFKRRKTLRRRKLRATICKVVIGLEKRRSRVSLFMKTWHTSFCHEWYDASEAFKSNGNVDLWPFFSETRTCLGNSRRIWEKFVAEPSSIPLCRRRSMSDTILSFLPHLVLRQLSTDSIHDIKGHHITWNTQDGEDHKCLDHQSLRAKVVQELLVKHFTSLRESILLWNPHHRVQRCGN